MKKPIGGSSIVTMAFFLFVITLSGCETTGARHDQSNKPLQRLQNQIDILNECMQPVLTRRQADLLQDATNQIAFSIGDLLATSLVSREAQEAFLSRYLAREGSIEDFWNSLEEDSSFSKDELYEFRLALFLGQLTQYHQPLLLQLQSLRQAEGLFTLYQISMLSRERWSELLTESGVDLEPETYIRSVDKAFDDIQYGGCN